MIFLSQIRATVSQMHWCTKGRHMQHSLMVRPLRGGGITALSYKQIIGLDLDNTWENSIKKFLVLFVTDRFTKVSKCKYFLKILKFSFRTKVFFHLLPCQPYVTFLSTLLVLICDFHVKFFIKTYAKKWLTCQVVS